MIDINSPATLFDNQTIYIDIDVDSEKIFEPQTENTSVIIFSYAGSESLPNDEAEQLSKILTACHLKKEQTAFVNTAFHKSVSLAKLRNRYPVKYIIVFGESFTGNNFLMQKYRTYFLDGIYILQSEPVSKLLKSPKDKKALWEQLQVMYELV